MPIALVPARPAAASHAAVSWVVPDATATLVGDQRIEFTISAPLALPADGRAIEWDISLWSGSGPGATKVGTFCRDVYGLPGDDSIPVEFLWDTRFLPTGEPSGACDSNATPDFPEIPGTPETYAPNGTYTLQVWVKTSVGTQSTTHEHNFQRVVYVENAPASPTGVRAAKGGSSVTVTWDANAEPSVTGYAVDQCVKPMASPSCASAEWSRVAKPAGRTSTSVSLPATGEGFYRYRVAAIGVHGNGTEFLSPASQSGLVEVAAQGDPSPTTSPTTTTTKPDGSGGNGGGSGGGGSTGSTGGGGGKTPGAGTRGGETDRSGLPPRTYERTATDGGYEENLPYGAKPLDAAADGPLDIAARGVGIALIPLAGGLVLFVFAMQMRYVSRRAESLAFAGAEVADGDGVDSGDAGTHAGDDTPEPHVPLFRLGAGGSFISNWRRLLDD